MTDYVYLAKLPIDNLPKGKLIEIRVTDAEGNQCLEFVFEDAVVWFPMINHNVVFGGIDYSKFMIVQNIFHQLGDHNTLKKIEILSWKREDDDTL